MGNGLDPSPTTSIWDGLGYLLSGGVAVKLLEALVKLLTGKLTNSTAARGELWTRITSLEGQLTLVQQQRDVLTLQNAELRGDLRAARLYIYQLENGGKLPPLAPPDGWAPASPPQAAV